MNQTSQAAGLQVRLPFALTVFISAFLLFIIQPLMAKGILPWFGGGPGVWTTSILFFQALLLGGYAYAHLLAKYLDSRTQMLVHLVLLAAAVALLPITPSPAWKPEGAGDPSGRILMLLTSSIGLQYFLLASTAPLVQSWFSHVIPGYSTYRLYALSNVGAIISLASYPFLVEPALALSVQETAWSWGFGLFTVLSAYCAVRNWRDSRLPPPVVHPDAPAGDLPATGVRLLWLALPAAGSVMLLAVTNHICQDIAVVPFLWVVPLSLYLLTFTICFDREKWYARGFYGLLFILTVIILGLAPAHMEQLLHAAGIRDHAQVLKIEIAVFMAGLFVICMVMHGELARLKPPTNHLTAYYLMIAAGGAIGGLLVALVAPRIFDIYLELPLGIFACCLLALTAWFRDRDSLLYRGKPRLVWGIMLAGVILLAVAVAGDVKGLLDKPLMVERNFYGVVRVLELGKNNPERHRYILQQSGITEGLQFASMKKRHIPTAYYGRSSGIGLVLGQVLTGEKLRVGAIGLGAGTVAAYGRLGDYYRFYDINPAIIDLANNLFTYLQASWATTDVIAGDARISLEREPPQQFDVLVLDAFSGDAIPMHLLTVEAFNIYLRHLKEDGLLAVHTSNESLDLAPVIISLADHLGLEIAWIWNQGQPRQGVMWSKWFLLSRDGGILRNPVIRQAALGDEMISEKRQEYAGFRMWTDDYSNLFQVMH